MSLMPLWVAISGPRPTALARYGVAVVSVAIALSVRIALLHVLDLHSPFLLLFAAVMLSSAYGGLGPGILATGLAALGSSLFISAEQRDYSDIGLFCLEGLFLSLLGALLHRTGFEPPWLTTGAAAGAEDPRNQRRRAPPHRA